MNPFRYAVAIPTMNRPAELRRCLRSVARQAPQPAEVIVIDDGALDAVQLSVEMEAMGLRLKYHRKDRPGLVASLNLVGNLATEPWVLILDDDIVLGRNFMREMLSALESHSHLHPLGLAGYPLQPPAVLRSTRAAWRRALEQWFLLGGGVEGRFLNSGFCTDYQAGSHSASPWRVEHVPGGLGLWRRDVLLRHAFDPAFEGYAYGNDKEFALRVSREGVLLAVPHARALHRKSRKSRVPGGKLGSMMIRNSARIHRTGSRAGRFSRGARARAVSGLLILSTLGALSRPWQRARWAMLAGMVKALMGGRS